MISKRPKENAGVLQKQGKARKTRATSKMMKINPMMIMQDLHIECLEP